MGGAGDGSEDIRYYEPEKTVILAGEVSEVVHLGDK